MTESTIQEDLAEVIAPSVDPVMGWEASDIAKDILASPQMQAIRKALRRAAWNAARYAYPASRIDSTPTYLRENCHLPASVIEWVMTDD